MKRTKILALALALSLALTLTACGASKSAPAPTAAPTEAPTAEPTAEPTPEPPPEPTAEPTEAPREDEAREAALEPKSGASLLGQLQDGNVYENTFLQLKCTLPEEWTFFNRDQLLELSGLTAEAIQDETLSGQVSQAMENGQVLYCMFATADGGLRTINLTLEKLNIVNTVGLTEEKYIEIAGEQLIKALGSTVSNIQSEQGTVTLAGEEAPALLLRGEVSGMSLYQVMTVRKQGGYMACFGFTVFGEDTTADMVSTWSPLE